MCKGQQPGLFQAEFARSIEQRWVDRNGDDVGQKHVVASQLEFLPDPTLEGQGAFGEQRGRDL